MELKISPFALIDLEESIEYYNLQKKDLGYDFANRVNLFFERIKNNFNQFPKQYNDIRKAKIDVFPFNIFFIVEDNLVYVLAIFHTSRNPKLIKKRCKLI